jgi:SAM-dependent methyltransferase
MPKYENANSHWITQHTRGRSFVDVGCMWGVTGDYSFLAEESGASRVVGVDIYPEQPAFLEKKKRRNSSVIFVRGDINKNSTIDQIQIVLRPDGAAKSTEEPALAGMVFCSGVLYHVPDPILTLRQLGRLVDDGGLLVLNTMTIPEQVLPCTSIFLPGLVDKQLDALRLGRSGVGLTHPFEPAKGYANWVWGMTPSCVRAMLQIAGFEIIDEDLGEFEEVIATLCRRRKALEWKDSSGDWSSTQGANVFSMSKEQGD